VLLLIDGFEDTVINQLQTLFWSNSTPKGIFAAIAALFCLKKTPEACWSAIDPASLSDQ
jgi:hypothetical protein